MAAQLARDSQLPTPRPNPRAISSRPVYEGWRTHRYGPRVTTAWSASTWMKVLNDRPSVSTAQTRRARPTQITTTPAAAKAFGAGVSSAGTQLRSRVPFLVSIYCWFAWEVGLLVRDLVRTQAALAPDQIAYEQAHFPREPAVDRHQERRGQPKHALQRNPPRPALPSRRGRGAFRR